MKMVKSVYKKILENVPTHMPETGGMLGGQDGTVTKVVFDGGKDDDFRRCHYTPNVTMLNSCLVEWSKSGIEFYGLFHTHFYGVSSLSKGDEIYIKKILEAMPKSKKELFFPIIVLPDKKIISYRCYLDGSNLVVAEDPVICVAVLKNSFCKGDNTMKEEMKRTQVVEIPEGTFEGNCSDCVYADWNDTDRYGRVYCRGSYGGYNNPSDRNGCFYYK